MINGALLPLPRVPARSYAAVQRSDRLLHQLHGLVHAGHTVVVVEHEMRVAAQADWVIDVGPGAGEEGGRIVAEGRPREVARAKSSRTAPFLAQALAGR